MPRVVHFEIHADDTNRAVKFYKTVFGWEATKWDGPQDYWLVTTGPDDEPGINGAIMKRHRAIDGVAVIAYVCTIDVNVIDDYLAKVAANGGEIVVPKTAVPMIGWSAYCKDTDGNIFGLMQADTNAR